MSNKSIYPTLFSPLNIGKLLLPNRIVMAPMTRSKSPANTPGPEVAQYYRRRAEGSAGLIITECTFIDHPVANGFTDAPAFHGESALNGWKHVVKGVHQSGGLIMPQIWHAGPSRPPGTPPNSTLPSIGPLNEIKNRSQHIRGMTVDDIEDIILAFGLAGATAKSIGFDGVEIHGAHSYLIDSFLWHMTNQRTDRYGGTLENRLRFACEIVSSVRDAVGSEFPISFRFSQWKLTDYEAKIVHNPDELQRLLLPLVNAGVDIFNVSTREFWQPAFTGSELTLAGWTKKITNKKVIAVGSVGVDQQFSLDTFSNNIQLLPKSVEQVEYMLKSGEFDLIAVGRAILADANWPNKIRFNHIDRIKPFSSKCLATLD